MNSTRMKPAAFKTGDRLKYLGTRESYTIIDGERKHLYYPGMEVVITETRKPEKGYGFIKNDEDGEPIIDNDKDGHNVFINEAGQSRIIWPEDKKDWKKIN